MFIAELKRSIGPIVGPIPVFNNVNRIIKGRLFFVGKSDGIRIGYFAQASLKALEEMVLPRRVFDNRHVDLRLIDRVHADQIEIEIKNLDIDDVQRT